jgi:hypothetical protein
MSPAVVADVADRAVWSLADLQELFDEWVLIWQTRPHEGLRHPFSPGQTASPNDAYAALIAAAGYVPVTLTGEDYIELLPAEWRAIGDTGVQIDYRTYNSPELRPLVGQSSGVASKNGRWEVHYDPYDVSRVWVRNHRGRGWFTVAWTHHSIVRQPFADFTWRAARRLAAVRGVDDANEWPSRSSWPRCCAAPKPDPTPPALWPAPPPPGTCPTICPKSWLPISAAGQLSCPNPHRRPRWALRGQRSA